ncbi:MAG: molecular chaperone HtpG [Ignavibacteriales bacterium]|nr:MAG: molecular chaperone HtpG [Ignavibacteriales bacterium]
MTDSQSSNHYEFKAEIKQLLNILVHSLYTHKEIFLRELISNASDALDKLRFESVSGKKFRDAELPLEIRVEANKDKNRLVISDTGIGMTREELVSNIGTIAKSGSAEFLKQIEDDKKDLSNIIGKFGVGFYSVFMVAKEVTIKTKSYKEEEEAVEWKSDGLGSYDINTLNEPMKRGTIIEIELKDEEKEFTEKYKLESVIKKHSNFISFPIYLENNKVNSISALWREPKNTITKEQYSEFFKFLTYDSEDPLETLHVSVDAPIQFNTLLFIPKKNYDQFGYYKNDYGLDLYVKRVLIQHQNKDLLPEYLGFIKGVVDSEDLPLNISRETLQENVIFNKIAQNITTQVLAHLKKIATDDPDKYAAIWKEHGKAIRLGYSDFINKDKFVELLRFNSSKYENQDGLTSLKEYVGRLKEGQKEIYYFSGPTREAIISSPHYEIFKSRQLEVLFLLDPIDEFVMDSVREYKEYKLVSIEQVDPKNLDKFESAGKEEKLPEISKDDEKTLDKLLKRIKEILGDKVTEVRISNRLTDSPSCLVNPADGMTSQMQKIMQIVSKDTSVPKKILEINKDHKLIRNLIKIYTANSKDEYIDQVVEQLYESSLLLEGYLTDPHNLVNRIKNLLEKSSDLHDAVREKT